MRLAIQAQLPDGASLRFFEAGRSDARYPGFKWSDFVPEEPSQAGVSEDFRARTRWSPSIRGNVAGVEIEIPPSAHWREVSFRIVGVSHIHRAVPQLSREGGRLHKSAASCAPVEAVCKSLPSCPSSAVAVLTFTVGGGDTFVCTGTAVNSTRPRDDNFDAPFVLTAEHCINSPSVADTVETTWQYEYSSCGGTAIRQDFQGLSGGAELLASDPDTDGSLLRLRDGLPNSACLAAWDATGGWLNGAEVTSLHHPAREVRHWAGGSIEKTGVVPFEEGPVDAVNVVWSEGSTQGGSSGSGLFTPDSAGEDVLIGMLSGGPADDCTRDSYGRLDRFFATHAGVHLVPTNTPLVDDHGGTADDATGVLTGSQTPAESMTGRMPTCSV